MFGTLRRAARRRAARLRDRLGAVGGHARRHARAGRARTCACWPRRRPRPISTACGHCGATSARAGLVQVAEQYLLMPAHAARLAAVRDGAIGAPTSVQVSSTHLYHAVSMIRGLLGVGFEPVTVTARAFTAPLADPDRLRRLARRRRARARRRRRWPRSTSARPAWASTTSPTTSGGTRCARGASSCAARPVSSSTIALVRLVDAHTVVESHLIRRSDRHRPQPRGLRPRPHQPRRRVRLPQPVHRRALLRGRSRGRAAARARRRLGTRRGAGAVPAGRGPAGSPAQRRDRRGARHRRAPCETGVEPWAA